jgi:hypothetical protein
MDLTNIEPRYIFGTLAITAAHLAGSTKRKIRKEKARRNTDSASRPNFHYRTYCPECPIQTVADPELNIYAKVSDRPRFASCKAGHIWPVRN